MYDDDKTLNELIEIESRISDIYNYLMDFEIIDDLNSEEHRIFIDILQVMFKEENTILSRLDNDEKKELAFYISKCQIILEQKYSKTLSKNKFSFLILERIINKLVNEALLMKESSEEDISEFDYKEPTENIIIKELEREKHNIFLSFIDEEIKNEPSSNERELLINYKYFFLFATSNFVEREVVNRHFQTGSSLILESNLVGNILGLDKHLLDYIKDHNYGEDIWKVVSKIISLYFEEADKVKIKIEFLKLRTVFLMLSENAYKENIHILKEMVDTFPEIELDKLAKDRERHQKLSLVRRKNENN